MEPGRMVLVTGLANRADLNGKIGRLLKYDEKAERWGVDMELESVRIRPCNLSLVDSMTLLPPIEDDEDSIMRASGPTNLESSGPVQVVHNGHEDIRRQMNLPNDAIIKTVTSPQGQHTLHYDLFKSHIQNVNIGNTRREIEESFSKGVWIGINSNKVLNPQTPDLLFCTLVGDEEWLPERSRLCQTNGYTTEYLDAHIPPRPFTSNRMFNILGFKMDKVRISYVAFLKKGKNNTEQHLLPMLLTDTTYTCNAVMIYACLKL